MEIIGNTLLFVLNILITTLIVVFNLFLVFRIKKNSIFRSKKNQYILWFLFLEHFIFTILYYLMSKIDKADSVLYYEDALLSSTWYELFGIGTNFIKFIVYPFAKAGVNYFNVFFIFSTLGAFGLYKLLILVLEINKNTIKWTSLIFLFLPTFHFYTSALGKDSIIFYLLVLFFFLFKKHKFLHINHLFPVILIFLIRPHLIVFLFISYFIVYFFSSQIKLHYKLGLVFGGVLLIMISLPTIEKKLNIDFSSLESISARLGKIQYYALRQEESSSAIVVRDSSVFYRMFAYSYLPLFWKSDNIIKHIVSVENLYLIGVLIMFLLKKGKTLFLKQSAFFIKLMFTYSLLTWFFLSFTLYNLGLSTRQKYMFIPFLYCVIFSFLTHKKPNLNAKT